MIPAEGGWRGLRADLMAGLTVAVVCVPHSIPIGAVAFGALGPEGVAAGTLASLWAQIFAGGVAAALGGSRLMVSGPRAASALVLASIVASVAAAPDVEARGGAAAVIAVALAAVLLSGLAQAAMGLGRLGQAVKYIPYPVVSGFLTGVGAAVLLAALAPIAASPGTAAVGVVTLLAYLLAPRLVPRMPPPLAALAAGVALHHGLAALGGDAGPLLGALPVAMPGFALGGLAGLAEGGWLVDRLIAVAPQILVLAVISSADSLMAAVAVDALADSRHDGNRELLGQGVSNMVGACLGGLPSAGSVSRGSVNVAAGARSRRAAMFASAILLVGVMIGGPLLSRLPAAVLAMLLAVSGVEMLDRWAWRQGLRLLAGKGSRPEIAGNVAVVVAVAGSVVAVGLLWAVAVGVAAAMALFVSRMSRPILRRVRDGRERRSLRVRDRAETAILDRHGGEIRILELEGPLFFGTADALWTEAERQCREAPLVVLDFRKVGDVDATGARLLLQIARAMAARGRPPLFAHLDPGHDLVDTAGGGLADLARWFPDLDAALEWAEDALLASHPSGQRPGEIALADSCLAAGLDKEDLHRLAASLRRRELAAGAVLFRQGEPGDTLYLLARGRITVRLEKAPGRFVRLATFMPGVMIGEMALLERQPRSAEAVAAEDAVLLALSRADLDRILAEHPALAARLIANVAREIAARLRAANQHRVGVDG